MLDSYCSTREGRLERWRYRMRVAEAAAAYKEGYEVGEALFGETEDKAEDNAGSDEALLRRGPAAPTTRQRTPPAPPRPHPAGNEGKDFPPLRRGAARRQRDRGHRRFRRGPTPLPTRPRHTENEEE